MNLADPEGRDYNILGISLHTHKGAGCNESSDAPGDFLNESGRVVNGKRSIESVEVKDPNRTSTLLECDKVPPKRAYFHSHGGVDGLYTADVPLTHLDFNKADGEDVEFLMIHHKTVNTMEKHAHTI